MLGILRSARQIKAMGLIGLAGLLLMTILILALPQAAYAKSYSMNKTTIDAVLDESGTLDIVEQRTFSFVGNYTYVYWDIEAPPSGSIVINGIKATDTSGNAQALTKSTDETAIDEASSRVPGTYLVLNYTNWSRVYVFFNLSDVDQTYVLDYTLENAAAAYGDVGEIYWKYVAAGWAAPSRHVTLNLTLPVPEGEKVSEDANVFTWSHGRYDGDITYNPDGTVTIVNARIPGGTYAEARVIFPVSWLTGMTPSAAMQKESIVTEETTWAEDTEIQQISDQIYYYGTGILYGIVTIALLVFCLVMFFKHGRVYKAKFTDKYLRGIMPGVYHPALIGFVWKNNTISDEVFTATLMRLHQIHAIKLDRVERASVAEGDRIDTDKADCLITINKAMAVDLVDPIDMNAYLFLEKIAGQKGTLLFSEIKAWSMEHAEDFSAIIEDWKTEVKSYAKQEGFVARGGTSWMVGYLVIAAFLVALALAFFLQNAITLPNAGTVAPVILGLVSAVVIAVIAFQMKRRSPECVEIQVRCEALHCWLRDFSALDDGATLDAQNLNDMLIMAVILGDSARVIDQLRITSRDLLDQNESITALDWCLPYGSHGTPAEVLTTTMSAVEDKITREA